MAEPGHNSSMSLGDNNPIYDLPAMDNATVEYNPWFQFDDLNLTYVEGQPTMRRWGGTSGMTPGGKSIGRGW